MASSPSRLSKLLQGTMSRKVGSVVAGGALVAGITMGAATAGSGARDEDLVAEREQVAALTLELADADDELATQAKHTEELERELAAYRAEEESAKAAAAKAAADAAAKKAAEEAAAQAAAEAAAKKAADDAAAKAAEAAQTQQNTAVPFAGTGGGSITYANCDDVRAHGAAPIRVGDPGYSKKLDRDGDGVGCE